MNKFEKNLDFLIKNPEFISNKLSKMSKVLSSHILGIKAVEKSIETDSPESLRKHVHALMITTAAMAEDVYILNLTNMLLLNSQSFSEDAAKAMLTLINLMEKSEAEKEEHIEVEEKKEEVKEEIKEPEKAIELPSVEIKVEESLSTVKEEVSEEQPVKKKRGRKKKNPE